MRRLVVMGINALTSMRYAKGENVKTIVPGEYLINDLL